MLRNILVIWLLAFTASAADWRSLDGIYALTAENYLDPMPEDGVSHLRIQFKDETAKDLFEAMGEPTITDQCTGALARSRGAMQCLHHAESSRYECHFSIRLKDQTVDYGVAC